MMLAERSMLLLVALVLEAAASYPAPVYRRACGLLWLTMGGAACLR
jgi:hypothetical protein